MVVVMLRKRTWSAVDRIGRIHDMIGRRWVWLKERTRRGIDRNGCEREALVYIGPTDSNNYLARPRVMSFSVRPTYAAGPSCCQERTAWSELPAAGAATAEGNWWQENQARRKEDSPLFQLEFSVISFRNLQTTTGGRKSD